MSVLSGEEEWSECVRDGNIVGRKEGGCDEKRRVNKVGRRGGMY